VLIEKLIGAFFNNLQLCLKLLLLPRMQETKDNNINTQLHTNYTDALAVSIHFNA